MVLVYLFHDLVTMLACREDNSKINFFLKIASLGSFYGLIKEVLSTLIRVGASGGHCKRAL